MRVRVLRPLWLGGERKEPGTEVDLADQLAREAIWIGKVERVVAAPPVAAPMTTESVPELVAGKPKTGKRKGEE